MSQKAEELTPGEGDPQVEITLDEGTGIPGVEEGEGTKRAKGRAQRQEATTPTGFEVGQADGTYTKAQVDEMLAKVRKEEKDKLYPQIDMPVTLVYGEQDWSRIAEREGNRLAIPTARPM